MVEFYGKTFSNSLMLGTALYPSPAIMRQAIKAANVDIVTVSLRRETGGEAGGGQRFWEIIKSLGITVLPNTASCYSVKEAVTTAHMASELFDTKWIKLEVIANTDTLQPDVYGLLEAAKILHEDGFEVFPYTTADLVVADRLLEVGCQVLMPWGSPIGSGRGLNNVYGLRTLRAYFPDTPLVIDAGLGRPSQAAQAMELGYDAVLLNTAVARAGNPVLMAKAFAQAVSAGQAAFQAQPIEASDRAHPSTPVIGKAFLS